MRYDILISGVGGQGTVLASKLLAAAAIQEGYFTRTAETIGMSQRGGSVVSHVRIGSKDNSPVIPFNSANLLIGFELAEAARNLSRLNPSGKCIVNTQVIKPVTSSLGSSSYDVEGIVKSISQAFPQAIFIDGYSLAEKAGSVKAVNVVLLGAACASGALPFSRETLETAIKNNVPQKFLDLNIKALHIGLGI